VRHVSKSGGLLRLEASRAGVSQSDIKIGGDVTMGGAHSTIIEVASRES
jgi:hypothetical protein